MALLHCLWIHLFLIMYSERVFSMSHFVNVALNKSTTSSDTYHQHFSSDQGVDGGLIWRKVSHPKNGSGVHTLKTNNPWWMVDLGQEYIIRRLKLYNRNDNRGVQNRMKGFMIFVSSSPNASEWIDTNLCYKDTESKSRPVYEIMCRRPMKGSYVTLKLNSYGYLNFRELEVYDAATCEQNWYGINCSTNCSDRHCANELSSCDITGSCDGNNCSGNSTQAANRKVCLVCEDGWFGEDCTFQCNESCAHCMGKRGQCISCIDGRYNVEKQCTDRCNDRKCSDPTATCPPDGHCSRGCRNGFYLDDCSKPCPLENCMRCDQSSGRCLQCRDGYFSSLCNQTCPNNCADGLCRFSDGTCFNCEDGYFGSKCDVMCSSRCARTNCTNGEACNYNDVPCDTKSGACLNGCVLSYYGAKCEEKCSATCSSGADSEARCEQLTGRCSSECTNGYYGVTCSTRCSPHCFLRKCHRETGNCLHGCILGVKGGSCVTRTVTNFNGSNDYISTTTFIIVVCVQSVLFIVVLIVVILYKRIRKKPENKEQKTQDQSTIQEGIPSSFTYSHLHNIASSQITLVENPEYST